VTLEGGDPVELARRYAGEGATRLHLVDLDGAFSGLPSLALVTRVAEAGGLPLQVGGGYRTLDTVEAALAAGADRVMVGTAALARGFLERAVATANDALAVAWRSPGGPRRRTSARASWRTAARTSASRASS
jgi:phosphoribosylformimino-5-aminoimidazole carboxamide ribotide isomerase